MIKYSTLLAALTAIPSINGVLANTNTNTMQLNTETSDQEKERFECTFMYVGKDISETGMAMVARTGDSPKGINHNMKIVQHNALANQTIEGINGFKHKMPSTTYRYIASPRSRTSKAANYWEVSCVNEKGVAVSATLSTYTNDAALAVDSQPTTGIGEDNLAQVVAACASTAREGVEVVKNIMSNQGSCESNAIMIQDKNEVWYMELYTGHEFCAIKMPDDKACTIGNEFMLNTLAELGIDESNAADRCVLSPNLFKLAKENNFLSPADASDVYHMHLFNTYARPLIWKDSEGVEHNSDGCHMRTWRGIDLFSTTQKIKYENDKKYDSFFSVPENTKLTINDIKFFMRDRFENILEDTSHPAYTYFSNVTNPRAVGTETAYQIHIMMVDGNLPAETSATEYVCLSNSCYAPFVPINAGMNSMNSYYTNDVETFGYDANSAICIYRNLNTLAKTAEKAVTDGSGKKYFATPVRSLIEDNEDIWQKQYNQVVNDLNKFNLNQQKQILTNYLSAIQTVALDLSQSLYQQLLNHLEYISEVKPVKPSEPEKIPAYEQKMTFKPLINLPYYSWVYGWNYSMNNNNVATLKKGNDTVTIDLNYGYGKLGKIKKNDEAEQNINVVKINNKYYIDYATAETKLADGYTISEINLKDYLDPVNVAKIVIPVVLSVCIVGAILAFTIPYFRAKAKAKKAAGATKK